MAISDKLNQNANANANPTPAPAPTPSPTPTPSPRPQSGKATAASNQTEAFRKKGADARANMTEDQKQQEGARAGNVEFICALGDPSRKQSRVDNSTSVPSHVVVGYKFKVNEDTTVPFAPIAENWKTPLDTEEPTERPVKAGEVVNLNIVETARFITRLEYGGRFTGGNIPVGISAKVAKDRTEPLPVLNKLGRGSIKENMELIADMVGADDKHAGTPAIKEEYKASFSALYRKKSLGSKSTGSAQADGETQKVLAAAFRAIYAKGKA